ncbi:hypothetical protein [Streptomyces sp. NBC_00239]|uniref:hypothetical protein n=1 Tax=Streptomyces sp. NBC_00239 TaxID=2903640 RepID=UPI002E28FA6C|nr:hypothetical protein [Streptomyces sp. NBC_00239]
MNQSIPSAATSADGREQPEAHPVTTPQPTHPADAASTVNADPLRTLVDTVATCRPLDQVTELVSLLKQGGRHPDLVRDALCTAAVARPVHEVGRLIDQLCQSPQEKTEAEITLRAAASERPIEDVATLVGILATTPPEGPTPSGAPPLEPADQGLPGPAARRGAPAGAPPPDDPYDELDPSTGYGLVDRSGPPRTPDVRPRPTTAPLRRTLRWPVGLALLIVAALYGPADPAALLSGTAGQAAPAVAAVLCLSSGVAVAVRNTPAAWWAAALSAVSVVGLALVGQVAGFDPLAHALGAAVPWANAVAMLCAAVAVALAVVVLRPPVRERASSDQAC